MKIAIQANPNRGKEIISLLETLGGTKTTLIGDGELYTYYIDDNNVIRYNDAPKNYKVYTLEEFEKEFPFKIGDKVTIITNTPYKIVALEYYMGKLSYKLDNGLNYNPKVLTPYKEMKEEINITLTLDKAKEWYQKGGELKEIALQAFTEKELIALPRSWEEFATNYARRGYYISSDGKPLMCASSGKLSSPHVCPSKESAEAHLAMIQLEQLRNCWWNGWEPIWDRSEKWCIRLWGNELNIGITTNISRFLTFPTREMAIEFLECFRDLIEKAGDLI